MLKSQVHQYSQSVQTLFPRHQTTFLAGDGSSGGAAASSLFLPINNLSLIPIQHKPLRLNKRHNPNFTTTIKAVAQGSTNQNAHQSLVTSVKATITVQSTIGGALSNLTFTRGLDDISDLLGKSILVELVAAEVDPKTGLEKKTIKDHAYRQQKDKDGVVKYLAEFEVPEEFGDIGGVLVQNEHHKEMYIKNIAIEGFPIGTINVTCNSWVHPKFDYPEKRIFFTNKSYLPSATPSGLKALREKDLEALRGDGTGERKKQDRIYDYDVYNDLGEPDAEKPTPRPVLGGEQHPYPRRCRTGRPPTKKDPLSESRSPDFYVPRDEAFSEVKSLTFSAKTVDSVLHAVVPSLETTVIDSELGFPYFTAIEALFNEGVHLPELKSKGLASIIPRILKFFEDSQNNVLLFDTPEMIRRDKFSWLRDEEFCRQMLAGVNPLCIQLVTEWPLRSKLDPEIYGPPESAITKECVEEEIRGYCTLEEALKGKKLFLLDYHDVLLPYVNKVRDLTEIRTTLYGSRTLMYLTPTGTLRPLAIELTRPPSDGKPHWNRVYRPCWDSTGAWLWKLAKVHVLAHDSGYHQLVSHWLRTHCCTEPYIIAGHRQLSSMHPIFRLLHPHFRYTMEINALARQALINANGTIETSFSTGKYSMELSSVAYDLQWRFDHQALPADLISRGMAVEDASAPHGLRLTIEDYPYANDGLVLWDIIKQWVSNYVNHYYTEPSLIESDAELQAWWTEIRTVGHGDKKDEPWWPVLKTPDDLIGILTTIIWVASGHHAAVNFGQYGYGGYIPNRATIARVKMPDEDPTADSWEIFKARPEDELLSAFPSQVQATKVMAVLDVLSNHSPDEEYIGQEMEPSFEDDPQIKAAFDIFSGRLKELEGIINGRNADPNLKNRNGVGIVPYELLKPASEPGVTGMGVPNSISI